jgi:hypothetical protein
MDFKTGAFNRSATSLNYCKINVLRGYHTVISYPHLILACRGAPRALQTSRGECYQNWVQCLLQRPGLRCKLAQASGDAHAVTKIVRLLCAAVTRERSA